MYRLYFLEVFMRALSTKELREREVINVCTGEKLGYICELEIDVDCGQVLAVTVPKDRGVLCFGKREEYIIPWCKIECIGEDTVLLKVTERELCEFLSGKSKKSCR